jgi:hypothetical protein
VSSSSVAQLPYFPTKYLLPLLCVLAGLTVGTYYHRSPGLDDAWIAEQAYWLAKDGVVRSEFFRGVLGWEKQLLVSHKLFLALNAGLMHLFGYSLPTLQFTGLIALLIMLAGLVTYLRKREGTSLPPYLLAVLILVFANRFLIRISFENRPDLLVAALGFWSFLSLNAGGNQVRNAGMAGFLAGLAMLCHLNGVIYLLTGAGLLLYGRQYRALLLFSVVGGVTGLTYFADILLADNGLAIWLYQFRHDPATEQTFGLNAKLMAMLTYPRLFFYTPEHAAISILFVFVLWQQRRFVRELPLNLKVYAALLFLSFWVITKAPSGLYLALFIPHMLLIIYELYKRRPFANTGLKMVLALYFIIGLYGTIELIYQNNSRDYLPTAYQRLRAHISPQETGLVPLTFFFNEYEQYAHLLGHNNFAYSSTHSANPADDLATWANTHKAGFILLDYTYNPESYYPTPGTKRLPFYTLSFFDGRFAIYKRQP